MFLAKEAVLQSEKGTFPRRRVDESVADGELFALDRSRRRRRRSGLGGAGRS